MVDPFAEKKSPWPKVIIVLVILGVAAYLLNQKGPIHKWTGYGTELVPTNSVPTAVTNTVAVP